MTSPFRGRCPASRPVLVVKVVEKPSVVDFRIEGNDEISSEDLKEAVESILKS